MKKFLINLTTAFAGGFFALATYIFWQENPKGNQTETPQIQMPTAIRTHFSQGANFNFDENSFVKASEKTINSVVHVKNMTTSREITSIFDLFYGSAQPHNREFLAGTGSGVIISPDGYIITNNHVIDGASSIEITMNNNKTYKAEIIGSDPLTDIALLKIKTNEKLPFLTFADSDKTQIGEWVLAVGNPFNLTSTVTAGIISAKARNLGGYGNQIDSFIQTDAAVNSGNSGGALVNLNGELIGINTAIAPSRGGTFMGYSFAVPSNIAKKVVEDLVEFGSVQKGILGIVGVSLDSEMAQKLNIEQTEGFYVNETETDSGAEKAGIQKGDIITQMDGVKIKNLSDLRGHINSKRPGDAIQTSVLRNGKPQQISVILQKNSTYKIQNLGLEVKDLSQKEKQKFKIKNGVKITAASDFYRLRGVEMKGKILISINSQEIKDINSVEKIVKNLNHRQRNSLVIINEKGERERFLF